MSAFNISYHLNDTQLRKECVFMKTLTSAKQSATAQSPHWDIKIEISDIMDNLLAERQEGKWRNLR